MLNGRTFWEEICRVGSKSIGSIIYVSHQFIFEPLKKSEWVVPNVPARKSDGSLKINKVN